MKVKITTTYMNVDQEWLDWYLKRLADELVLPGSAAIIAHLEKARYAVWASKDPSSEVTAQTEYEIIGRPTAHTAVTRKDEA